MKVGFIAYDIFSVGGIQRVVSVVASKLSEYHDIDVICLSEKCTVDRGIYDLHPNVKIKLIKDEIRKTIVDRIINKCSREINRKVGILNKKIFANINAYGYFPKNIQDGLVSYINRQQYDVVIGVAGDYSLLLGIIAERLNCKTIGWQHNSYDAYLNNRGRYHWNQDELFNKFIPNLDRYIVLTKYDKNMFWQRNKIKSMVMHNPRSFNSTENSTLKSKQFLAAGRFNYQKGFDLLIQSFYEFSKCNEDWTLVIVGEGEEEIKINKLIHKYGLENRVRVDGFTDNIKNYFLESSALLLPSRWEGMPMIVLESLEMGVPIISYNITAIQSMLQNNKEGLVVEKFDTKEFAQAMNNISKSSDLRVRLGKNAKTTSKKFDINSIVIHWNNLLENI